MGSRRANYVLLRNARAVPNSIGPLCTCPIVPLLGINSAVYSPQDSAIMGLCKSILGQSYVNKAGLHDDLGAPSVIRALHALAHPYCLTG